MIDRYQPYRYIFNTTRYLVKIVNIIIYEIIQISTYHVYIMVRHGTSPQPCKRWAQYLHLVAGRGTALAR